MNDPIEDMTTDEIKDEIIKRVSKCTDEKKLRKITTLVERMLFVQDEADKYK